MAEIKLGESVAVLGVGPVGQSCVAFASLSGAGEIICVGAPQARLEFAQTHGRDGDARPRPAAPSARSKAFADVTGGRGVDVVIEASGAPDAVRQALDMVRDGGRVIVCGHYTDNGAVEIHPHWQINRKHVEIKGCWGSRYDHFHRAVALTARVRASEAVAGDGERPLRRSTHADEALAAVEKRTAIKAIITPNPQSA